MGSNFFCQNLPSPHGANWGPLGIEFRACDSAGVGLPAHAARVRRVRGTAMG